jgi:hypothetical protein
MTELLVREQVVNHLPADEPVRLEQTQHDPLTDPPLPADAVYQKRPVDVRLPQGGPDSDSVRIGRRAGCRCLRVDGELIENIARLSPGERPGPLADDDAVVDRHLSRQARPGADGDIGRRVVVEVGEGDEQPTPAVGVRGEKVGQHVVRADARVVQPLVRDVDPVQQPHPRPAAETRGDDEV